MELLEDGQPTHKDWLRFLDEEMLYAFPTKKRNSGHACSGPITGALGRVGQGRWVDGVPPENLVKHGLLLELEDGMWLHEALRERLLRDVGEQQQARKQRLD